MIALAMIFNAAENADRYVATWREGEIFIEPIGSFLPPEIDT